MKLIFIARNGLWSIRCLMQDCGYGIVLYFLMTRLNDGQVYQ